MVFQRYGTSTYTPPIPCISDESTDVVLSNTILSTNISDFTNIFELVFMSGIDLSLGDLQDFDPISGGYYGIDICSTALLNHIKDSYEISNGYTANYPNIEDYPSSQVAENPLAFNEVRKDFIYDFGSVLRDVNSNIKEFKTEIVDSVLIDSVRKITRSTGGSDSATLLFANSSIANLTPIGMQLRIIKNRVQSSLNSVVSDAPSDPQDFVNNMDILLLNHQKRRQLLINLIDSGFLSILTPYNPDGISNGITFGNEYYILKNRGSISFSFSFIGGTSVNIGLLPNPANPANRTSIQDSYSVQDISLGIAYPQLDGYSPSAACGCGSDIREAAITFPVGIYYNDILNISGGGSLVFPVRILETDISNTLITSACKGISIPDSAITNFDNVLICHNLGVGQSSFCNGYGEYTLDVQGDAHISRDLYVDGDISVHTLNYVTLNPPVGGNSWVGNATSQLDMNCYNIIDICSLSFCNGTYIGPGGSFDISSLQEIDIVSSKSITLNHLSYIDPSGKVSIGISGISGLLDETLTVSGNSLFNGNVNISGELDVSSQAIFRDAVLMGSSLDVSGELSVGQASVFYDSVSISGSLTVDGTLDVSSQAIFRDAVLMGSSLDVSGEMSVGQASVFYDSVSISGSLTVDGTVDVSSQATFRDAVSISGSLAVDGTVDVSSQATFRDAVLMGSSLDVSGEMSVGQASVFYDSVSISGSLNVDGAVDVSSQATFRDAVLMGSSLDVSGELSVGQASVFYDSVSISGSLNVDGAVDVSSQATFRDAVLMGSSLDVSGELSVGQASVFYDAVSISGSLNVDGAVDVSSQATFRDAVLMGSSLDVSGEMSVGQASVFYDSVSISGSITVDGTVDVSSQATFRDAVLMGSSLDVSGELSVGQASVFYDSVSISGSLTVDGAVDVSSQATFRDAVLMGSSLDVSGELSVGQASVFFSDVTIEGLLSVSGDVDFSNNLRVSKNIDICGNGRVYGDFRVDASFYIGPESIILSNVDKSLIIQEANDSKTFTIDYSDTYVFLKSETADIGLSVTKNPQIYLSTAVTDSGKVLIHKQNYAEGPFNILTDPSLEISGEVYHDGNYEMSGSLFVNKGIILNGGNLTLNKGWIEDVSYISFSDGSQITSGASLTISGNVGFGKNPTVAVDVSGSAIVSGNLGIRRTPSPSYPLDVIGNTRISIPGPPAESVENDIALTLEKIQENNIDNKSILRILSKGPGGGLIKGHIGTRYLNPTYGMFFNSYIDNPSGIMPDTAQMCLTNQGNLGINRNNPSYRLDVSGNTRINEVIFAENIIGDTTSQPIPSIYRRISMGGGNSVGHLFGAFNGGFSDGIHLSYNAYYTDSSGWQFNRTTPVNALASMISARYGRVEFSTREIAGLPPIPRMVVDSIGRIGVRTSNPTADFLQISPTEISPLYPNNNTLASRFDVGIITDKFTEPSLAGQIHNDWKSNVYINTTAEHAINRGSSLSIGGRHNDGRHSIFGRISGVQSFNNPGFGFGDLVFEYTGVAGSAYLYEGMRFNGATRSARITVPVSINSSSLPTAGVALDVNGSTKITNGELYIRSTNDNTDVVIIPGSATSGSIIESYASTNNNAYRSLSLNPNGGNVGINLYNPEYPLDINQNIMGPNEQSRWFTNTNDISQSTQSHAISVNATGFYRGTGFTAYSDKRIKNNIIDIYDDECLEIVRRLQPKKYNYIDIVEKGSRPVYGFIAQEVAEVIPYAVNITPQIIPDYYSTISPISVDVSNITFQLDNTKDYSISDGTDIRLIIAYTSWETKETKIPIQTDATNDITGDAAAQPSTNPTETYHTETITLSNEIVKDTTLKIIRFNKETQELIIPNELGIRSLEDISNVFFYGKNVTDFHNLNKDSIWTVATSALQEVDRIQQVHNEKLKELAKSKIHRGKLTLVSSTATINLDAHFEYPEGTFTGMLNLQVFLQNNQGWSQVKGSIIGNDLTILAKDPDCTDEIDFMIVADETIA
jgi:acyl-[acyl carrier protein]--UDP-N-acetylglucosamine O-acyltransferase